MFPLNLLGKWSAASARERLRKGNPPRRMRINGHLDLANSPWLRELPSELVANSIDVSNCANLRSLPRRVKCQELVVARTSISQLEHGLEIGRIDASDCRLLQRVDALRAPELRLRGCTLLNQLSEGLEVRRLDLSGCTRLATLPASVAATLWNLDVSGCTNLDTLPNGLTQLRTLNVQGCTKLASLPDDIRIQSSIDVADSALTTLPYSLRSVRVLWRGMVVPDRIAFDPESITVDEVLHEQNLELRRVLIERIGMDRFIADAQAQTIDNDTDAGGARRLLRVPFENGENIVCLEVHCPSTGRKYLLRVPPRTPTCAAAAAWIAGFNSARLYRPLVET
jgi:hypothetical protein